MDINIWAVVGFCLAGYSIVANDAIQTLGTFLASNSKRPWWILWLFSAAILVVVLVFGFVRHGGDVSYGRLDAIPTAGEVMWMHWLTTGFLWSQWLIQDLANIYVFVGQNISCPATGLAGATSCRGTIAGALEASSRTDRNEGCLIVGHALPQSSDPTCRHNVCHASRPHECFRG